MLCGLLLVKLSGCHKSKFLGWFGLKELLLSRRNQERGIMHRGYFLAGPTLKKLGRSGRSFDALARAISDLQVTRYRVMLPDPALISTAIFRFCVLSTERSRSRGCKAADAYFMSANIFALSPCLPQLEKVHGPNRRQQPAGAARRHRPGITHLNNSETLESRCEIMQA